MGYDSIQRKRQSGQIIVIAPILILLMLASMLLAVNVSIVARERIKIQVSSDAASRDGALVQAKAISAIGLLNDGILAADAVIADGVADVIAGLALIATVVGAPEGAELVEAGLEQIKEGQDTAKPLREAQEAIMEATPVVAEGVVIGAAITNGGYLGSIVPGLSHVELDLEDSPFPPPFVPIKIRATAEIKEKIVAGLWKAPGGEIFGNDLLRGLGGGRDLTYPGLTALSGSRPYWFFGGHDPRDKEVGTYLSMITLGLGWNAKLEKIK